MDKRLCWTWKSLGAVDVALPDLTVDEKITAKAIADWCRGSTLSWLEWLKMPRPAPQAKTLTKSELGITEPLGIWPSCQIITMMMTIGRICLMHNYRALDWKWQRADTRTTKTLVQTATAPPVGAETTRR